MQRAFVVLGLSSALIVFAACGPNRGNDCAPENLLVDEDNCGYCGHACNDGEGCVEGVCTEAACQPGTIEDCYSGSEATLGIGVCHGGMRTCNDAGSWSICVGEVTPAQEVCGNGVDENCSGQADENVDLDMDGYTTCDGDCADAPGGELVNPGAFETNGNAIDDDCDGEVDETGVKADCVINPGTLNLNAQGSVFSIECKLSDNCDPANPTPIPGAQIGQVYLSRADSAATSDDDDPLPDPSAADCPDPVLGSLFERGIVENLDARDNTPKGATFKFNLPSDGFCETLDGDRQDLGARLFALPDGAGATLCISGKRDGIPFQACTTAVVRNKGPR